MQKNKKQPTVEKREETRGGKQGQINSETDASLSATNG